MGRLWVVLVSALFLVPSALAATASPGADGTWTLSFDVRSDAARRAHLTLAVVREDADGTLETTRDAGWVDLPAGASTHDIAFLPAEGPGAYNVTLLVDGVAAGTAAFDVEDAGATARVSYDVPDEPTTLRLTSDAVNADNKSKAPGEALVTRATLSDGNGVGDVDGVVWQVERDGALVESGTLEVLGAAENLSAPVEHRYVRSPLAAGTYSLTLHAIHRSAVAASATRTFVIREAATTLASGQLAPIVADANGTQEAAIVLADRNGAPSGPIEARVYRGSARAEGAGLVATLGAPSSLPDQDGAAMTRHVLSLAYPAYAAPGAYRVSLYGAGALIGSLPFEVRELPTLTAVDASTDGGALRILARGVGNGTLVARLGDAPAQSASFANGAGEMLLRPAARSWPLAWSVALHARADGPPLAAREGAWTPPLDGPPLTLTAHHARGRLPAAWIVDARGWGLDEATANVTVSRWDGAPELRVSAALENGRLRLDGPADLEAGRYDARMLLTWANGSASEATWSFEAGPWTRVTLGEATIDNGTVRVPVRNDGGRAISRLVVESDAKGASWRLDTPAGARTVAASGPRAVFRDVALAPGESGEISFALSAGPKRAGAQSVTIRVLAPVGP